MTMSQPPKQKFFDALREHLKSHLGFEHVSVADGQSSVAYLVTGVTKEGLAVHYSFTSSLLDQYDDGFGAIPYICDAMKEEFTHKHWKNQLSQTDYFSYEGLGGALQPPPDQQPSKSFEAQFDLVKAKADELEKKLTVEQYQLWAKSPVYQDVLSSPGSTVPAAGLKKQLAQALQGIGYIGGLFQGQVSAPPKPTAADYQQMASMLGLGGDATSSGPAPKNMYELYGVSQNGTEGEPEP